MRLSPNPIVTFLFLATASLASADRIALDAKPCDLYKATNPGSFQKYKCDVLKIFTEFNKPVVEMRFNESKASFGQDLSRPKDWSKFNILRVKIRNKENRTVNLKLIVQLGQDSKDYGGAFTGLLTVGPYESKRFICFLNTDDPSEYGMEYMNPVIVLPYTTIRQGNSFRDLSTIYHWRFSYQDTQPARVQITDFRLLRQSFNFANLVDKWGQYCDRTWPDKITSDTQLRSTVTSEDDDLAANPGPGELDGTDKISNPDSQPGRWRIVKSSNGMKYFQHPSGKLFWSLGVSAVHDGVSTRVDGRENMFKSLPSRTGTYASAFETKQTDVGQATCFSFWKQNLMVKYGADYLPNWESQVKSRLKSWGINTLGIQCLPDFMTGWMPFTILLDTDDFPVRLNTPQMLWGPMPDPYDSTFKSYCIAHFTTELLPYQANSNLMGAFVDNEISWGKDTSDESHINIALGTLQAPPTQPAKIAFISRLMKKYGTISALNSAWGTSFSSFTALKNSRTWTPSRYTSSMMTDFLVQLKSLAIRYYSSVREALDSVVGFRGLYLGSRFCDYSQEVVDAAEPYVDVLSFNYYRFSPAVPWDWLNSLSKPVLISEFGYGTQDRGTFGGPAEVSSFAERSKEMGAFLADALSKSNLVGCHWYCYADQPVTGRWSDGENSGKGLVDTTDQPYAESVETLRDFSNTMYSRRR